MVVGLNVRHHLAFLDGKVTLGHERSIVASVAVLLDLYLVTSHDIANPINKSFILFFKLIPLKICHFAALLDGGGTSPAVSMCLDGGFDAPEVGIVPGFVLKVDKLLCLFDIH